MIKNYTDWQLFSSHKIHKSTNNKLTFFFKIEDLVKTKYEQLFELSKLFQVLFKVVDGARRENKLIPKVSIGHRSPTSRHYILVTESEMFLN